MKFCFRSLRRQSNLREVAFARWIEAIFPYIQFQPILPKCFMSASGKKPMPMFLKKGYLRLLIHGLF